MEYGINFRGNMIHHDSSFLVFQTSFFLILLPRTSVLPPEHMARRLQVLGAAACFAGSISMSRTLLRSDPHATPLGSGPGGGRLKPLIILWLISGGGFLVDLAYRNLWLKEAVVSDTEGARVIQMYP